MLRVFIAVIVLLSACAPTPLATPEPQSRIAVDDPRLREALAYLETHSSSFRSALQQLSLNREYIVSIERKHVDEVSAQTGAQVVPLESAQGARVMVYTGVLEERALERGYAPEELTIDLALILGHEIYAHIIPAFEQGVDVLSNPCPDPHARQHPLYSCALKRENRLRRELGLQPRTTHSSQDLGFVRCAIVNDCRSLRR